MATARTRRASSAHKVARRRPMKRTTTTTTTTRVVRQNPRRRRRRNPSASTEAVYRRQARIQQAILRRSRTRAGGKNLAKLGHLHGAFNRAGAVVDRRWRAEDAAAGGRLRSMKREAALVKAIARARRRRPGSARLRALESAHKRSGARLRRHGYPTIAELERQDAARRKRRRRNPMAKRKRTAAQRRAFRKMQAGLRAYKARKSGGKKRRARARRRRTAVVVVNPRKRRKKGAHTMAKRRRTRRHRRAVARHNPRANPRRRRHHHRRRRRNPGGSMMTTIKDTVRTAIPAVAGGAVMSIIDAKLLADKSPVFRVAGKLLAAAAAGMLLRKRPQTAHVLMGAMLGTLGYELGANFSGGIVAPDKKSAVAPAAKAMQALIREDPAAMNALVTSTGVTSLPSLEGTELSQGQAIYDDVNLG